MKVGTEMAIETKGSSRRQLLTACSVGAASLVGSGLGIFSWPAQAQLSPTTYRKLSSPVATTTEMVEVLEFFWYGCPHCHELEPFLNEWEKAKGKTILFKRIPVAFRSDLVVHQKLFYALEVLGQLPQLHGKVFKTIQTERNRLLDFESQLAFVQRFGVDAKLFTEAFNSFGVASKCMQATQLVKSYQIDGVPAMGVDGVYTTSASIAGGSYSSMLKVVDQLIDLQQQVRKTRKK